MFFVLFDVVAVALIVGLTCGNVLVGGTGFEPAASSSRSLVGAQIRAWNSGRTCWRALAASP